MIEKLHPTDTNETATYVWKRYLLAKDRAKDSTLSVGMIARDCEAAMARTLSVVDDIAAHFKSAAVQVVTNDNSDGTADVLAGYEFRSPTSFGWVESTLNRPHLGHTRGAERTVALAEYRNRVKALLPPADYVLILDADLLEITEGRIMAGLGDMLTYCWHAMAAQCLVRIPAIEPNWLINYDAFAFRPIWGDRTNYMIERAMHYDVRPSGTRPYRVRSAFGGVCWYRGDKYNEPERAYCGEKGCEHVPFHEGLVMGVSPSMSVIGFLLG